MERGIFLVQAHTSFHLSSSGVDRNLNFSTDRSLAAEPNASIASSQLMYMIDKIQATPGPASYQTVQLNRKKKKRNVFELKIPEELMTSKEPEDDLAWQQ